MSLDIEKVRVAARESFQNLTKRSVRDDQCFVSTGIIDSLSVLKLINLLEQKLKTRIPTGRIQPEDFDSVDIILETLQRIDL